MNSSIPSRRPPVVLVPACNRMLGQHPFHVAGQKYVDAVRLAGALPLVVPSASREELDALLDLADGVLLTGSPSNVHPSHFGQAVHDDTLPLDCNKPFATADSAIMSPMSAVSTEPPPSMTSGLVRCTGPA